MISEAYLEANRLVAAAMFDEMQAFADNQMANAPRGEQVVPLIAAWCERSPTTFAPLPVDQRIVVMMFPRALVDHEGVEQMLKAAPLLAACGHASSLMLMSPSMVADAAAAEALRDVVTVEGEGVGAKTRVTGDLAEVERRLVDVGSQALLMKCESDFQGWAGTGAELTVAIQLRVRRLVREDGRLRWSSEWEVHPPERRNERTSLLARGAALSHRYPAAQLRSTLLSLAPTLVVDATGGSGTPPTSTPPASA